jgi:DNA-binding LytR/AlgR family response regulator
MQELSSVSEISVIDQKGIHKLSVDRITYVSAAANRFLLIDDSGTEMLCELNLEAFIEQMPPQKFYRINSKCIVSIDHVRAFIISPEKITVLSNIRGILKTDTLDDYLYESFIEWLEYN